MGVGGGASAASILLIACRLDENGVVHGSGPRRIERAHVEDVDALHLSQNLQTLQTSGLLEIRRDASRSGTGCEKILFGFDFCNVIFPLVFAAMLLKAAVWRAGSRGWSIGPRGARTAECLHLLANAGMGLDLVRISCRSRDKSQLQFLTVSGRHDTCSRGPLGVSRRITEAVKLRRTMGETVTRRAAARAVRDKNIVDAIEERRGRVW